MLNNGGITNVLESRIGRQCTVITDSGAAVCGVISEVGNTTCTVVSTVYGRCSVAQRLNVIPIDKISCVSAARL